MAIVPQTTPVKHCPGCDRDLPATPEYFNRDKTHTDGFRSSCKECRSKKYAAKEGYNPANASLQKQCAKCDRWFPATLDHWNQDKRGQYGLHDRCKECVHKAYVARDPHPCARCHIRTATLDRLCDECYQWKLDNPDAMYCPKCNQWLSLDCFDDKSPARQRVCNACRLPKEYRVASEEAIQKYIPSVQPCEQDPKRARQNKHRNERAIKEIEAGKCSKCLARPAEVGSLCQHCYDYAKQYRDKLRNEVLTAYGSSCAVCGETHPAFLSVDHIDNDGADHRRITVGGGQKLYLWLRRNNFPPGFQILCANHNWQKFIDLRSGEKNYDQIWYANLRQEVIAAYGSKCTCCGESNADVLTIDHVNNDGADHRREIGGGIHLYTWLRKEGFPQDGRFQILCFNCNRARYFYGVCPH